MKCSYLDAYVVVLKLEIKIMTKITLTFVALAFMCMGCPKSVDSCETTSQIEFNQNDNTIINEYYNFSKGTYWVMRDSVNHDRVDTIKVIQNTSKQVNAENEIDPDWCEVVPFIFVDYKNTLVFDSTNIYEQIYKTNESSSSKDDNGINISFSFSANDYDGNSERVEEVSNVKVNDIEYKKIKKYSVMTYYDLKYIIYRSSNTGIIKVITKNDSSYTTWELIKTGIL